jgi:hypothetical protein
MKIIVVEEGTINTSCMYYSSFTVQRESWGRETDWVIHQGENIQCYINLEAAKVTIMINKCHRLLNISDTSLAGLNEDAHHLYLDISLFYKVYFLFWEKYHRSKLTRALYFLDKYMQLNIYVYKYFSKVFIACFFRFLFFQISKVLRLPIPDKSQFCHTVTKKILIVLFQHPKTFTYFIAVYVSGWVGWQKGLVNIREEEKAASRWTTYDSSACVPL